MKTLKNLFLEELADRYDSEKQLLQVMPRMAESASCTKLKDLIRRHQKQTEGHMTKVEKVFKLFGEKPVERKCQATVGLLREGSEIMEDFKGSPAIDAAIVSAAQKIEHYEIASYGCLCEWAKDLKNLQAVTVLKSILEEEGDANKALMELARSHSNDEAMTQGKPKASCCNSRSDNTGSHAAV